MRTASLGSTLREVMTDHGKIFLGDGSPVYDLIYLGIKVS